MNRVHRNWTAAATAATALVALTMTGPEAGNAAEIVPPPGAPVVTGGPTTPCTAEYTVLSGSGSSDIQASITVRPLNRDIVAWTVTFYLQDLQQYVSTADAYPLLRGEQLTLFSRPETGRITVGKTGGALLNLWGDELGSIPPVTCVGYYLP